MELAKVAIIIIEVIVLSRKPRIEFNGAVYHVFQRGNNKENIFSDPIEKGYFIKQIKDYMSAYEFELFAYVIMDNHYHLAIRTNRTDLNKIMHSINSAYSKYYNYRHQRTGHVFEERYKSKLVEDDAYLIWLIRYIHRNPVRAHMCDEVNKYKWSSDFFYRKNIKSFVNIELILNILSVKKFESIKKYYQLMNSPEEIQEYDYQNMKAQYPVASFRDRKTEILENIKPKRKTLDEIIGNLNLGEENTNLIKSGSRKRHLMEMKLQFINEALKNKYTQREIGDFIGISQSGVTKLLTDR